MADRWQRLESLCHAALALPAAERAAYLREACAGDDDLRREVESLVAGAESTPSFLEHSPGAGISLSGRQLGAYRLDGLIAAGGMGAVYHGRDTRLGRDVAVKILPAAWSQDAHRQARFEREARAIAALKHPNICTIHDVGRDEGIDFLVMELVDGETLSAAIAKGPLPLDEALTHATEIADALDSAHQHGIVHRDLKPGNVMLARTGSGASRATQAKLLDFGLARIVAPPVAAAPSVRTASAPMTETGALLGTLQYMAPEQIEGRPADARTDIFAFGLVLFEMLTGRHAFEGSSTAAVMAAILRADPPRVHPDDVDRIVRRCLAKDPLRRYQTARDLLNDLDEVRQRLAAPSPARAKSDRRLGGWPLAWVAGACTVAGAVAGYVAWARPSAPEAVVVERLQIQPPAGIEVVPSNAGSVLAISPDGRWVAFRGVSRPQGEPGLYLRSIGELNAKKLAMEGTTPFFSADSRWLGFFAQNGMYKVPVEGGRPVQICPLPNVTSVRGASWADGETIVFSMDRALWRVASAGGDPVQLTHPAPDRRHYWPAVLPDRGAVLLTVVRGINDRWRQLGVASLKTGDVRILPELSGTAPRYLSSGYLVYSYFGALHAVPFDPSRLDATGTAVKILDNVNAPGAAGNATFDLSASGSLVYVTGSIAEETPEADLVRVDRRGKLEPLPEPSKRYLGAALDPDGNRLAVSIADALGEGDLWLYEMDRAAWTQLTSGWQTRSSPAWSPDGKSIFFTSFKSGEGQLCRIPSRGGTPEQLTSDLDSWNYPSSVTPDGTTVLYTKSLAAYDTLMALRLDPRGTPQPLTGSGAPYRETSAMVSPDGRWVAYSSDQSGTHQIHVRPLKGSGEPIRISPSGGISPRWSRDGRELVYQRGTEFWSTTIEPGDTFVFRPPRLLFTADVAGLAPGFGTDRFIAIRRRQGTSGPRMLVYAPNWGEEVKQAFREHR